MAHENKVLRRHAPSLEAAVDLIRAVILLGGSANLYDMTAEAPAHWLVEIYALYTPNDWPLVQGQEYPPA